MGSHLMVTDITVEKSLEYLASTDRQLGEVHGRVEGINHHIKTAKAVAFLEASGTVGERQAHADCNPDVVALINEYENVVGERETIRTTRKRAELTIEVWRTQQASSRRGHL